MDDDLQYVNLAPGGQARPEVGAESSEGVLYVQDGMVQGPAGEQYVTIIQNGQTYAIPTSDYAAMLSQPDMKTDSEDKTSLPDCKKDVPVPVVSPHQLPVPPPQVPICLQPPSAPQAPTSGPPSSLAPPITLAPPSSLAPPSTLAQTLCPPTPADLGTRQPAPVFTSSESVSKPQSLPPVLPKPTKQEAGSQAGTKQAPGEKSKKKIFSSKDSPRKYLYPTIQEVIKNLPEQSSPKKNYKPIKVDNWGIFLLSRLQNYFQKKEFCDMTLRFPSKNAQIKVHKLIINACTDYFCQLEKEGKMVDGAIDMPANFTPETLAPIIRFMYTGKIDLKEATYEKLHETADILQMGVLTKLMDAQVNALESETVQDKKNIKRSSGAFEEDPIEQMRKIRRIEKKVALEGKKSQRQSELDGPRLPGKKLPIWKRKVTDVNPPVRAPPETLEGYKIPKTGDKSEAVEDLLNGQMEEVREEEDGSTRHIKIEPLSGQLLPSPVVGATYKKRNPGEKPKIPRKLQEIQQHLMFEKVLKSGTKNTVMKKEVKTKQSKDLSIEEVKELMQEQKQRMEALTSEDQGDDDEFDYNDDTLGMDDDYIDNIDSPAPLPAPEPLPDLPPPEPEAVSEAGPAVLAEPEHHKKTIRFSHKPSSPFPEVKLSHPPQTSVSTPPVAAGSSDPPPVQAPVAAVKSKPLEFAPVDPVSQRKLKLVPVSQVGGQMVGGLTGFKSKASIVTNLECPPQPAVKPPNNEQSVRNELDEALEEFSRVAEEEAEELASPDGEETVRGGGKVPALDPKKPRRGRPPRWLKEQTLQMGVQARTEVQPPVIDLKQQEQVGGQAGQQAQVITELLKKHPNLLRDNKAVKVKIMTKDAEGKSVTKFITLKAQQTEPTTETARESSPLPGGFKPLQKVMYTGKRGRPKKVKPGEYDPHQEERRKIEERLKRDYPHLASQLSTSKGQEEESDTEEPGEEEGLGQFNSAPANIPQMEPASSGETMPDVTNGLAASLGLPTGVQADGSAMMGQYQPGQALVMENGQIHILTQPTQMVNVDNTQAQQGDFIQILTSDGQVQQFALAKNKINQPLQTQPFSFLPGQTTQTVPARMVSTAGPAINIQTIGELHTVGTSIMSLAHPPLIYNTNPPTTPVPAMQQQVYPPPQDNDRVVNKIVSDWDSDEECPE